MNIKNTRIHVQGVEQWSQFFSIVRHNWHIFDFFSIGIDHDLAIGNFDFNFIILGFGFRVTYEYETKMKTRIRGQVNELKDQYGLDSEGSDIDKPVDRKDSFRTF